MDTIHICFYNKTKKQLEELFRILNSNNWKAREITKVNNKYALYVYKNIFVSSDLPYTLFRIIDIMNAEPRCTIPFVYFCQDDEYINSDTSYTYFPIRYVIKKENKNSISSWFFKNLEEIKEKLYGYAKEEQNTTISDKDIKKCKTIEELKILLNINSMFLAEFKPHYTGLKDIQKAYNQYVEYKKLEEFEFYTDWEAEEDIYNALKGLRYIEAYKNKYDEETVKLAEEINDKILELKELLNKNS